MKAFIVLPLDKIERGKGDSTYRGEGKRAAESISTILVRVSCSLPLIGLFNPSSHNFRDPFSSHRIDFTGFHSTFRRNACRPTLQLCNYWDNLVDTLIFVSYEGIRWRSGGRYFSSTAFQHLFFSVLAQLVCLKGRLRIFISLAKLFNASRIFRSLNNDDPDDHRVGVYVSSKNAVNTSNDTRTICSFIRKMIRICKLLHDWLKSRSLHQSLYHFSNISCRFYDPSILQTRFLCPRC